MALLAIVAVIGCIWYFRNRPVAATEGEPKAEGSAILTTPEVPAPAMDGYPAGRVLHHKETGEKVEIIALPPATGGQYTILWPGGGTGRIYEEQLNSWFI